VSLWRSSGRRGVAEKEWRIICAVVERNINGEERCCYSLSTVKDALLWTALLLVFSNHLPASLLSPELCLFVVKFADTVDGGFALSLAGAVGELKAVGWG
jgi:hypothetical protein